VRSVGIDVASANYASVALAVDDEPRKAVVWKPLDKRQTAPQRLDHQYRWLRRYLNIFKPDVIAVEELAVFMNKKVIRSLARHEGIALLAAKQTGAIVISPPVSTSRGIVLGNGRLSKDDAWLTFKKRFPDFTLLAKNSGGTDQMDAMTHALAAPAVLERRR
jgi:Holliday junction resolvasome RuvABC endonuclease subunit